MLTSKIIDTIEHPDEPGVTFTVRRLSYRMLEEAEDAKRDKALGMMKSLDGITLPDSTPEQQAENERKARSPENKYDRATVLRHGITAWTYGEPCDEANKADLDDKTANWLFAVIIKQSTRSADEGEGSGSYSPATTA